MRKSVAAAILAASLGPADAVVARAPACNANNCLRALANTDRAASAYAFCTSFLSASLPVTATAGLPSFVANCGPNYVPSLSSACPCFLATATYRPSSATSSSTVGSQPPTTCSTSVSTVTITTPGPGSTCPPPTTITGTGPTATSTSTITITGSDTCPPPSTITGSPTTTTASCPVCPSPTTATEQTTSTVISSSTCPPPSTITSTTTLTLTTPGPTPSTCAQPVANPSFNNPSGRADPWQFGVSGAGNNGGAFLARCQPPGNPGDPDCPPGGAYSDGVSLGFDIPSGAAPGSFVRLWQAFTPCGARSTYRTTVYVNNDNAAISFTLTLRIYLHSAGSFATALAVTSTRTVSGVGWQQVVFDTYVTEQSSAIMYLDVSPSQGDVRFWLDEFVSNRIG